jgi:hypothetical protein
MEIATGAAESHPGSGANPMPYNPAESPATARPTAIVPGQLSGPTVGARDTMGEYAAPLAASERDIATAQASGMGAENDRRAHYGGDILPLGAAYGDPVDLPLVPANTVPPASSDLYPWSGTEPTPAGAGLDFYAAQPPV